MRRLSRSPLRVRAQALAILGTTLSLPAAPALSRIGKQPTPGDTNVAGIATTVVRPSSAPPWPALVFMNGATPGGRSHPTVHRLGLALARAGVCVFIPELAKPQTSASRSSEYRSAERSRSSRPPMGDFSTGSRSSPVSHRSAISPR
jgi:hypothetical protein